MKILIVTNLYPPYGRGGAEIVLTRIVTELLAQGHHVSVITTRPYGGLKTLHPRLEDQANERIYRFYPLNIYHPLDDHRFPKILRLLWHLIDAFNPFNGLMVRSVVENEQPDVIWTHNLKGIGLMIPLFLRRLKIRHVHHVHDVQLVIPSGLLMAGQENPKPWVRVGWHLSAWLNRHLFDTPDVVVSPSRFLQTFYQKWRLFCHSQMMVLPNPAPKIPLVDRGSRTPGSLRLLFVGQLEEHKGIRFLIESLEKFDRPFELTIAGEGNLGRWIHAKAIKDRRFHPVGFVALEQLLKLFQAADVLVVPSLCYENSPTVIYEALQAGLPVVAAEIGGVGELITKEVNGCLFPAANTQVLLMILHTLDDQKEDLHSWSDRIRSTVADLSIDRYVAKLIEIFKG